MTRAHDRLLGGCANVCVNNSHQYTCTWTHTHTSSPTKSVLRVAKRKWKLPGDQRSNLEYEAGSFFSVVLRNDKTMCLVSRVIQGDSGHQAAMSHHQVGTHMMLSHFIQTRPDSYSTSVRWQLLPGRVMLCFAQNDVSSARWRLLWAQIS